MATPIEEIFHIHELFTLLKAKLPEDTTDAIVMELAKQQLSDNKDARTAAAIAAVAAATPPPPPPSPPKEDCLIPPTVRDGFKEVAKLHRENWHSWKSDIISQCDALPEAQTLLFDEEEPSEWTPHLEKLNLLLSGMIQRTIDKETTKSIRSIVASHKGKGARSLVKHLEKEICTADNLRRGLVRQKLMGVRVYDNNVGPAITKLEEIQQESEDYGSRMADGEMINKLQQITYYNAELKSVWHQLSMMGLDSNWEDVKIQFRKKEALDKAHNKPNPQPRPAALTAATLAANNAANGRPPVPQSTAPSTITSATTRARPPTTILNPNSPSYLAGRPGADGSPARCYGCNDIGHIKINCPNRNPTAMAAQSEAASISPSQSASQVIERTSLATAPAIE
ncbi:hypothetical protein BCV69DRAFT_301694 [Microstroma glucosiphilum]|uniref:CCHC-type domain-containing protein n=1 Tax=Pseudomicrostroma glucosiphilum TaxID=1684307 RepID=A0A316TZ43_9BASI|nr:hypothetical protein BCV69DRAFT_301694 [Pseudomicrostroma glucosiphilum]PWN17954.1 hypothetical protein BCV69DRAFT_301694 [Pseudomicrostroma glucosiphilum]